MIEPELKVQEAEQAGWRTYRIFRMPMGWSGAINWSSLRSSRTCMRFSAMTRVILQDAPCFAGSIICCVESTLDYIQSPNLEED
jgi:hypothetical protein